MLSFLQEVLNDLHKKHQDLSRCIIILPSKRAGGFFKNYLKNQQNKTSFAPKIISIEELIEGISGLSIIDTTELFFKSYSSYLKTEVFTEKEEFESFTTWITTVLNDFNEIDRYLIDTDPFFSYLSSIKTLEKWNVRDEQTPLIKQYLSFWDNIGTFYNTLKEDLLDQKIAYQGLAYRKAAEQVATYISSYGDTPHIFIGFNALNSAEQHIFQKLLTRGNSEIYWDLDKHFYSDTTHGASLFIRDYVSKWNYYQQNKLPNLPSHYSEKKRIRTIAVQKNIGQAKYIGEILEGYSKEELNKTALVLADEQLLLPVLHSLPTNIDTVNITMGVPLDSIPLTVFFELLLSLHLTKQTSLYYKQVIAILNHPAVSSIIKDSTQIINTINKNNASHLSLEELLNYANDASETTLKLLFSNWEESSAIALQNIMALIEHLKEAPSSNNIYQIALYNISNIFKKVSALQQKYPHLKSIRTVQALFNELVATTALDYQGDAYNGLQIMGVLETRVLDFENVIIASMNEGVLPAGKSNASFITYDLKKAFELPLYTEKDAIYTYHFYRLLQRAKNIVLLYNNHSEGINTGEKSRFLMQLEIENLPNHIISQEVLAPSVSVANKTLQTINKNTVIQKRLQEIAANKFSPSALTAYIRNPVDFYYQKVLRIDESDEVEETVAANTLGTVVHESLEALYTPFVDSVLTIEKLQSILPKIDSEVTIQFEKVFKNGIIKKGKNLLIFEVAKRYISNFVRYEIGNLNAGDEIKLLSLEKEMKVPIEIPQLDFPVNIGGTVDRVDEYNGVLRIIDYKTGNVSQGDVEVFDWDDITKDYKYSKAFQVLAYATMMNKQLTKTNCEAGIISFKNLQSGFLKFATKDAPRSRKKDTIITSETLDLFQVELRKLILEIFDPTIPFTEKEID